MRIFLSIVGTFCMVFLLTGCSKTDDASRGGFAAKPLITDTSITETYQVKFVTSKGEFVVEVYPEWAPVAATQFHKLVEEKFYDECRFYRVVDNFMVQVGMNGDPKVQAEKGNHFLKNETPVFRNVPPEIKDDSPGVKKDEPKKELVPTQPNMRGNVTFAQKETPDTRSTQFFVNYVANNHLDGNFPPFGKVISGMDVVDSFYSGYGGNQIEQESIALNGNNYLKKSFPKLDYIKTARIITPQKSTKKESEKKTARQALPVGK